MNRVYPSKILLFGEYAVLAGGEALAIPYAQYHLQWTNQKPAGSETKKHLLDFLAWLKQQEFSTQFNLGLFEDELNRGLDIESNIPVGYGLGSSGAVVAAVYDRYCNNKLDEKDLAYLKSFLAGMENFFHGQSSGLDPLVSYLQSAVHIKKNIPQLVDAKTIAASKLRIDLIDTGQSRQASTVIERFNEMMQLEHYKSQLEKDYLPLVETCIAAYLKNDLLQLKELIYKLSSLQLTLFSFAIPSDVYQGWITGLMFGNYYKLCGAGGGGYMLSLSLQN